MAYLHLNGVLPAEVQSADTDREKTYLMSLPAEPDKAYCASIYDGELPPMFIKQAGLFRVQILMRNPVHAEVLAEITALWTFLVQLPEPFIDITETRWAIVDCQQVPLYVGQDKKGNHLYSLNFPVTTKIF